MQQLPTKLSPSLSRFYSKFVKQILRFGIIGTLATAINCLLFLWFVNYLKWLPLLSNAAAFLVAFIFSYYGHSWWTFQSKNHSPKKLIKFLCVSILGLAINSAFVFTSMHVFKLSSYVAILPMIFITPLLVFVISKYYVFQNHPKN